MTGAGSPPQRTIREVRGESRPRGSRSRGRRSPFSGLFCRGGVAVALLAALGGCSLLPQAWEDTGTDALPPRYTDPNWIQVATFNIDWLWSDYDSEWVSRTEKDYEMIARIFTDWDLDLVALQEINGEEALELLPLPDHYAWAVGESGWSQNPAILYRDDLFDIANVRELTFDSYAWPSRKPLVADVRWLETGMEFTFVVVAHKAYEDDESAAFRQAQAQDLYTWVTEGLPQEGDGPLQEKVILAGDWNDTFGAMNYRYPSLEPFEQDKDWYFTTWDTDEHTYIGYESTIDHIVLSERILAHYPGVCCPHGCKVIAHDVLSPYADYEGGAGDDQNISSHRPVWVFLYAP